MRRLGAFWAVVVAVLLSGGLVLVGGGTATALPIDVVVPTVPPPVTVLPSVLKGALVTGVGSIAQSQAALAVFIRNAMTTPQGRAALAAYGAGGASPAQVATVQKIKTGFKMPAVKVGALVKGAGVAGVALMSKDYVVGLGHGVLEDFGLDVEGDVCATGSAVVSFLSSVNCAQWEKDQAFVPNVGMSPVAAGWRNDVFWWGGHAGVPNPSWVGRFSGSPEGQIAEFSWVTVAVKGSFTGFIGTALSAYCRLISTGSVTESSLRWAVSGPVGLVSSRTVDCGAGRELLAIGRPATSTTPGALLVNPGGTPERWVTNDSGSLLYFSPASPLWTPEVEANPQRLFRCQVTLSNGATLTAETALFRETDPQLPAVVCPDEFPAEFTVTNVTIWEVGGGETHELYNQNVTPEYSAAQSAYPECMSGTCLLDLRTVAGASCFSTPDGCVSWFEDPNKETNYTCHYGSHAVALSECTIYAPTFKADAKVSNAPYGDPTTGEPLPNSGPGSRTGTGFENPENNRECFPTGWAAFNPVEWVMRPVQCAIEWAFVPSPQKVSEARESIKAKFNTSAPGRISVAISTALIGVEFPTGCEGITVPLDWMKQGAFVDAQFPNNFRMLNACPGDVMQPWAVFSSLVVSAGLVFVAFKTLPALLGKIFTYTGIDG